MSPEGPATAETTGRRSLIPSVESALTLTQLLAILASGCWILYTFLTFQAKSNETTLRQQTLATQQAEFTLNSQKASDASSLQQARLAALQAQLSLDVQKSQRDLRETELKFEVDARRLANEQARLALQIQQEQRVQRDRELQYDVEAKRLSLALKTASRFSMDFALSAKPLSDTGNAAVFTFEPNLKVVSEVGVQMTVIIVDVYRGTLLPAPIGGPSQGKEDQVVAIARRVCPPPGRWSGGCPDGGAIRWSQVGTFGSYYPPGVPALKESFKHVVSDSHIVRFGDGVGPWQTGDRIAYTLKFILDANKDDYVGVSVHFLVNEATKEEDIYWYEKHGKVADLLANEAQQRVR